MAGVLAQEFMMTSRVVRFLAIVLTGVALIPSGAHLLEMPNKMNLPADRYFVVQQIYAGWALWGVVQLAALGAVVALAVDARRDPRRFRLAVLGVAAILVFFAVIFTWTWPANQATLNWTRTHPDWEQLRRSWEVSHALNAVILLLGFGAVVSAAMDRGADARTKPIA
jgi:hypothetical protein